MRSSTRTARKMIVPAIVAAFALTACQDSAPTAAPPSQASPTAEQSQAQPTESPSSEESSAAPTQAPSSGGGGNSDAECDEDGSYTFKKGTLDPKPRDETQTAREDDGDGQAEVSFGEPTVDTSSGDSFFPGDGMQTVIVPVTVKVTSDSSFIVTRLAFGMEDGNGNACEQDVLNAVVPNQDEMPVELLDSGDSISKKIGFAVPAGADLSTYTLIYANDYNSGQAELAWKAQ